jgi:hypothetical protein
MDEINKPGVMRTPRYIYLSTTGSGSPTISSPATSCPGTSGLVIGSGGRNSISPHFPMPTPISLAVTGLVTCVQNRLAASKEVQIPAASSAKRVHPTVSGEFRDVRRLPPVGTRAPLSSVPTAKSSMKMLNSIGERGQPCRTPRSSLQGSE